MANPKAVVELPQFLLPRLTWTRASVKGAASQIAPPRHHRHRPRIPSFQPPTQYRASNAPLPLTRSFCNATQTRVSCRRPHASSQPLPAEAAPIRHNGVYVAAFKPARRAFSATAVAQKDHHFDTLKFVQRLKAEGFNEEQAVAMMRVLNDVIEESIQNLTRTMVLKEGEEPDASSGFRCSMSRIADPGNT